LFQLRIFYQIHECKIGLKWHAHAVTAFPITHRKHEIDRCLYPHPARPRGAALSGLGFENARACPLPLQELEGDLSASRAPVLVHHRKVGARDFDAARELAVPVLLEVPHCRSPLLTQSGPR